MNQMNELVLLNQTLIPMYCFKKVAFCFWGLLRNLKTTLSSIQQKLFQVFQTDGWEIKIFLHTFLYQEPYTNYWSGEQNIILDNDEYKLLNADYIKIEYHQNVVENINFMEYRTQGNPWKDVKNSSFQMLDNYILGSYSKMQVTKLLKTCIDEETFIPNIIIYCRPDVLIYNNFPIECIFDVLNNKKAICIPAFECYGKGSIKVNDRFAICNIYNYKVYGNIFKKMKRDSYKMQLHAETYLAHRFQKKKINIKYIKFYFDRVRANGVIMKDHKKKYKLKKNNK